MTAPSRSGSDAANNMPSMLRGLYQSAHKPDIKINLDNRRTTCTTLDKLQGVVQITAPTDTSFDDIDVEFVGTSRTYVERLTTAAAVSGRSEAFHQFLKLLMPRMQQHYPQDKILKAGQTYEFPFVFVVPPQLLPRICQHKVANDTLRDAHTQLPPSFGDLGEPQGASKIDKLDDMAPEMASIRYGVFARISKNRESDGEVTRTTLASKARRLRIIPSTPEQPPLAIDHDDAEYTMRKERVIRKGPLRPKLGTLVVEATQPPSMRMHARSEADQQPAMATIMLRFDPVDEKAPPPRLGSLSSKLKVCTYFASTSRSTYPTKQASLLDMSQGLHSEQLNLASRCVANVEWTKHDSNNVDSPDRRDPASSTAFVGMSTAYKGKSYYLAKILAPVSLPTNKAFVPTFHSCLISRVYQLKLELGLHTAGLGGTVDLKIPLQISCQGSNGENSPRRGSVNSSMEMEMDDEDVGGFFEARTLRIPDDQYVGRSRIGSEVPLEDDAPPGYSYFSPQNGTQRVPVF
ncbi:Hypothetical predicted protein [Lecanosticta acicola]|uniref:Arrestin-like N-terminal domain-containing protein n=1 Tax=Lecanosticta acicola TaxID=111012 RepID=A0AAI8Z6G9_9PEZI|nr:Hypothetical predicted protein [Lecanosticta acicola]